jgi:Zinc finger, C2H2 type
VSDFAALLEQPLPILPPIDCHPPTSLLLFATLSPSMPKNTLQTSNPTVRIHHSSPAPSSDQQPMLAQSQFVGGGWNEGFPGAHYLNAYPKNPRHARFHKRASSGSSVASAGPPSPLDHTTLCPRIATEQFSPHYENLEYMHTPPSAHTSKSVPTPTSDVYMYPTQYGAIDMRRIHSTGADDNVSYALSGAPSVSTMSRNSPSTPHTNYEVDFDDSKTFFPGEMSQSENWMAEYLRINAGYPQHTPAYQQSLHDVFPEQFTNAMAYPQQHQALRLNAQMQQPPRPSTIADRLQAAQQDHLRANTPLTSNPREKSPFRQNSPFSVSEQMRASVQRTQQRPTLPKTRTSVSPKELQLNQNDLDDPNATPLFADEQQSMFANRRHGSNMSPFYAPGFTEASLQIPPTYQYVNRPEASHSGLPDLTPDFPAHISSMESTVEEVPSERSSPQSTQTKKPQTVQRHAERPTDTSSDSGTYSCTYHGCLLRFDTPVKLQKHKREGHRQVSPSSPSTNLALRNSQAGPHKCERINPSTGKPCNSIFSRPYDLTRHEDTIHNGRKIKVRCHLCTEEKTFSRNDALTRHMRVVHPDIEWPGKQKRRTVK